MPPAPRPQLPARHRILADLRAGGALLACALLFAPATAQAQQTSQAQQIANAPGDQAVSDPAGIDSARIDPASAERFRPRTDTFDKRRPNRDIARNDGLPPVEGAIPGTSGTTDGDRIGFEADAVEYNANADIVVASGDVMLRRGIQEVRADTVTWNRASGRIVAEGDIRLVDRDGNTLYTERVELTDELRTGTIEDLLVVFARGGRLAAEAGERLDDERIALSRVAYSACEVEDGAGCPKTPSWRLTAERVIYDPEAKEIRFRNAWFELFGRRILPLPQLVTRTDGSGSSGLLVPDLRLSTLNGLELSGSYYFRLAQNRDLTLGGTVFTGAPPLVNGQYRQLTGNGAFQVTGYLTQSRLIPIGQADATPDSRLSTRGYVFANGRFQLDPNWSASGSIRVASDRTFLRRYDINRDDRLRSTVELERVGPQSYFSLAGWATQTLRVATDQGQEPVALPVLDYRRIVPTPLAGGRLTLQANTLGITRTDGQDTQRAFTSAQFDIRRITAMGQEVTFTAMARGDVYHTSTTLETPTVAYRGDDGFQGRGIALGAVDIRWPFIGRAFGGSQVFAPRVAVVALPPIKNLAIPNEDSRAIDLLASNLFALNRFPGYDRVEDGVRVAYGFDWTVQRPGVRMNTEFGQSYRFDDKPDLFPGGTGLQEQFSDFVGRTEIRWRDLVKFVVRYRLDKDNLAIRRGEFDAAIGNRRTYLEIAYLALDRDIDAFEDLIDRQELRAAGRFGFARYWSVFGSGVFDLSGENSQIVSSFSPSGLEPLRTRLGVAYADDCLEMGLTWRRDYAGLGDAQRGNTFQFYVALRNLGFR